MLTYSQHNPEHWDSSSSSSESQRDDSLREVFDRHFETRIADTNDLLSVAQRLRYQVYCVENGYEDPAAHPDALERDVFDSHAVHGLLMQRANGTAIGTVRLILPLRESPEDSFAIQRLSGIRSMKLSRIIPFASTAEVSRFSISRQFRRGADFVQNSTPLLRLGLIQSLVRMSLENGITHWCAMMEPTLLRMLAAMAIRFDPIGAPVQHRGWRQPCFCDVAEVMACVRRERPAFWDVLTMGGSLAV